MFSSPDIATLFNGLVAGDRSSLARAITLVESRLAQDEERKNVLLDHCARHVAGKSGPKAERWALTGPPGVGKSSLIDRFGMALIGQGYCVAVLAVDPSSEVTGGSILGDKTRMENLAREDRAFIRPSPAGSHLGGVSEATRETALLCQAAGFDRILVETVGVGQSEHAVRHMVDVVLLVTMLGAGDELQGIKRGILEAADIVIVNKADGAAEKPSSRYAAQLEQALSLLRGTQAPKVLCASAISGTGIEACLEATQTRMASLASSGQLQLLREAQRVSWFEESTRQRLMRMLEASNGYEEERQRLGEAVLRGEMSPWAAARMLVDLIPRAESTR